jgi:3-phosphoglycerate kinase
VQVSTKLPVLESMLTKCDTILIGGGMMFTFSKAQVSAPLWPSILASAVA